MRMSELGTAPEPQMRSGLRVKGRPAIIRSLRSLQIRVARFARYRVTTADDARWAARVGDAIAATVKAATDAE